MKILLINNNPVVSRLTALSARKEDIEIDEIQEVTELNSDSYDIVFVDADSWSKDVRDVISDNIKTQKSVLFYADGDEDEKANFDLSILKPFLPSEVSAVIRSIEEEESVEAVKAEANHFNILDEPKVDNKDDLFDLNGLDDFNEKKEEVVLDLDKDLSEGTEKLSFDDKLEEAFPLKINTLDDDLFDDEPKLDLDIKEETINKEEIIEEVSKDKKNDINTDLFDLDLSDEIPSLEDDLFAENKKEESLDIMDKFDLDDELLEVTNKVEDKSSLLSLDEELALELDTPKVEEVKVEEVKNETKILDPLEIENIKGILTEDISNDMRLEDLMPPMPMSALKEEVKEIKEDKVIEDEISTIDANVLGQTLSAMPVKKLRELLAGATVKIKIKFPESK